MSARASASQQEPPVTLAAIQRLFEDGLKPVQTAVSELSAKVQPLLDLPAAVQKQADRCSDLEVEVEKLKFEFRLLRNKDRDLNIAVFPKQDFRDKFGAVKLQHMAKPLGLPNADGLVMLLDRPGVKVIRCDGFKTKAAIMRAANRRKASAEFHIVLQDDLDEQERHEKKVLQPVMDHLYKAGLKPTWRRSTITWYTRVGELCQLYPWELSTAT